MLSTDQHEFSDVELTHYLLGMLPVEKAERLDELCITDDDYAWRLRGAENDLVDAYVRSELSGEELTRFRISYLSSPKRREKVAFAEGFLRFQKAREGAAGESKDRESFFTRIFAYRNMSLAFAAVAILLLIASAYLLVQNSRLRSATNDMRAQLDSLERQRRALQDSLNSSNTTPQKNNEPVANPPADSEHLKIVAMVLPSPDRGLAHLQSITVHPDADLVILMLTLESRDFPVYRVTLKDPVTGAVVWHSGDLETTKAGGKPAVAIHFRANLLKTQNYVAEVTGISSSGSGQITGDYSFHVVVR